MREIYNSSEFEYTRFIYLRLITQRHNDSVNAYYERFHHMLIRQKKTMKYLDDQYFYHYIFIVRLKKDINIEILCLSESIRMKNMKFNKILELIKHIEQIVNCQSNAAKHNNNRDRKIKSKDKFKNNDSHHNDNIKINHEKFTPKEKFFLAQNIQHEDEIIVNEELRNNLK